MEDESESAEAQTLRPFLTTGNSLGKLGFL